MMRLRAIALASFAVLLLAGAAGAADARKPPGSEKVRLKAFSDCSALVKYGKRHVKKKLDRPRQPQPPSVGGPGEGRPLPSTPHNQTSTGGSSGTNVQEGGVDEPDLVKSKGSLVFAATWGGVQVVDTAGGSPRLLDTLKVDGGIDGLLLRGDRLLALGSVYGNGNLRAASSTVGRWPMYTTLTEIDVSDPADLKMRSTQTIDGDLVAARLNGPTVRAIVSSHPRAASQERLRNRAAGWRPSTVLKKAGRKKGERKPLLSCRKVRRAKTFSGMDMLTVLTIDMDRGLPAVDSDAVLSNGELAYASKQSLYVATQRDVPEPDSKDDEPPRVSTLIHKFDASDRGETSYVASGKVRGTLLSQWSMSEHEGALRVASTDNPWWWGGDDRDESESFVTVLKERPAGLEQVGRVGGLGRGEDIFAVRFIGDVGYVVTFRQIDPLYTIDLADPESPRVAGELKIRGYSAYLHPVGDGLLLGVGQDATERGVAIGMQLSLFDVSDPAKPTRLHQHRVAGDSWTDMEYDHHAFLWWGPEKLAVVPLVAYDEEDDSEFVGAAGFRVDRGSGIDEVGRATHRNGDYDEYILRSLVVDGRLFTMSDAGLELNAMDTLAQLAWVPFPQAERD